MSNNILKVTKKGLESEWTYEKGNRLLGGKIERMMEFNHPYHYVMVLMDNGQAIKISNPDVIVYYSLTANEILSDSLNDATNHMNL